MQQFVPVIGEDQQRPIELFRFGIELERRVGRIAVAVDDLGHFAILDARGAMPGLDDELVLSLDVAKDQHFDVRIRGVADFDDFSSHRHPAAEHTLPTLERGRQRSGGLLASAGAARTCRRIQFGEILVRMIGARVAHGKHGHGVIAFLGADEGGPTPAGAIAETGIGAPAASRPQWRRRGAHALRIGIAVLQQFVGEQIRSGPADFVRGQTQERRFGCREAGFRALGQNALSARSHEHDGAIARAEVFIGFPRRIVQVELGKQSIAIQVGGGLLRLRVGGGCDQVHNLNRSRGDGQVLKKTSSVHGRVLPAASYFTNRGSTAEDAANGAATMRKRVECGLLRRELVNGLALKRLAGL